MLGMLSFVPALLGGCHNLRICVFLAAGMSAGMAEAVDESMPNCVAAPLLTAAVVSPLGS
jgi:hypothetical protein